MKKTLTLIAEWQFNLNLSSTIGSSKKLSSILLAFFLLFSFSQTALAWNLPPDPSCESGSFVWQNDISYDGCDVYSDAYFYYEHQYTLPTSSYPSAFNGPVTININEYVSWDGYCGRENTGNQPHETWKVVFLKNGNIAWETGYTADVATGEMDAYTSGSLGSHYFANGFDKIVLVHWNDWEYGEDDNSNANSVYPASLCISFDEASEVSIACPSNVSVTASAGQNSAVATWNTPSATTTCMVSGNPDCSQISNNIDGFVYMGEHNNSKYYCSDGGNFTWNQAISYSAAAGGYLVTINNSSENEFVRSVIGGDKAWIGYTDANSENDFYWVNGENSSYSNWKSWAPDGGSSQDYTVMYKEDGRWNDKGSNCHAEFVMEIPCSGSSTPGNVSVTRTSGQASGSSFTVGTHTVTYQATDDCGNTETCSFTVTVNPGQPATPASVGNYVWSDVNGNGIQDAGEPGIANVFVMITDCAGNWVNNMVTDANGMYSFTGLTPGSYKVKFAVPADHTLSPTNAGGNNAVDSDVNQGWTGFTDCFDLASGQDRTDIDAGFVPQATPGGELTLTCSDNMTFTTVPGQNTTMVSWTVPTATSTCAGGSTLTQTNGPSNNAVMAVGTQTVSYSASDNCGNYETCTFTVTVNPGVATTPGSVGNFVWSDVNGNGIQDAGEPGIPGVFVMLTDCAGNWKGQTTTDASGAYTFNNVAPGSYKVKFVAPADHTLSPTNAGSNDAVDSDINQGWTGFTDCFDVASGQSITNVDAGFVPQSTGGCDNFTSGGSISGTQTICAGESAGMLTNTGLPTGGSGDIEYMWLSNAGTSCPVNVNQAVAGATGTSYSPGVLTETTSFRRCARRVGCTNWVGESNCVTVTVDQTPNCGGGNEPASVGNFVFSDTNGNGIQDAGEAGIPGVFIMLTDCAGNWKGQTTSDASGAYSFTGITPGSYKVKFVAPADHSISPTNAGSNDAVDSDLLQGWTGFTECFDLASGQDRTDIDAGFVPQAAPGGDLSLTCGADVTVTAAAGQNMATMSWTMPTATSTCAGGATLNQTAGPVNGAMMAVGTQTVTYTATDGCGNTETCSFNVTVNPGQGGNDPASVGNFVFSDTNGNGIQDAGEAGIPGVFIMLTDCAGTWKGQTTSDASGAYSFTGITPGSYKVKFVAPADHSISPTNAGSNDAVDSDLLQGWTGFTECFDLASGQDRTDIDAGFVPQAAPGGDLSLTCGSDIVVTAVAGQNTAMVSWTLPTATSTCTGGATLTQTNGPSNNAPMAIGTQTVSYSAADGCGNYETCSFTVTVNPGVPTTPGSVGNFVWSDTNGNGIQDAGEPGLEGVFVMLTDCEGNWKGQTTTDASGAYLFSNVAPGSYKVKFVGPLGSTISPKNAGSNGAVDSDVNQGWTGFTDCFDVASGQNITYIDAGFVGATPTGDLTFNCNANMSVDAPSTAGAVVTWSAPTASSTCTAGGVSVSQTSGPTSGTMLTTGTHTVTYSATDGCGNTETCSFTITVSYSGPAVCATRTISDASHCNGNTYGSFWAEDLVFGMYNVSKIYHIIDGTFTEYEDGTAHFTATVENSTNSNVKFALDYSLTGRTTSNSNSHDAYCFEANKNDWYYYTNMTGTISGIGALAGAEITSHYNMYLPQLGTGGNMHQNVFGFGSWVTIDVVSQPNNSNYSLDNWGSANADFNFNLSGSTSACTPEVTTCATREVWDAYQCDLDQDFGLFIDNMIDGLGYSAKKTHYEEKGYSTFVEYTNGTAHLSMKVRNNCIPNIKFQVELDFSGRTFDMPADPNNNEYGCYDVDNSNWYYYTNVTGTITGLHDMEGAVLNVWNVMHPFQIGNGAALWGDSDDFGGTTWLGYSVVHQPNEYYYLNSNGQMDVNIRMSGNATACGGNSDNTSSSIMTLELEQDEYTADLTWANNTGDVNDYFIVQRSADGINYTAIAQVESDRTAESVVASYNFKDAQPLQGENFYQVVAVTNNAKLISNKTKAVFGERNGVSLFPNPAGEFFMIDLLPYKGVEAVISISDQLGRTVKSINIDEVSAAPLRVNLGDFQNGYYNVQVQTVDGRTATKKLVVSRNY